MELRKRTTSIDEAERPPSTLRLESVDVLRGLAVSGMILVNNPGSWTDGYPMLAHAAWNGWTFADLIFPAFLFVVGISVDASTHGRLLRGRPAGAVWRIFRRAAMLFGIGLLLNSVLGGDLSGLRIPGVLQRIAVCYAAAALLRLRASAPLEIGAAASLLALYWLLMGFVPVPGHGAGVLELDGNLAGYLDDRLMHGHLYRDGFDPEGLLSTLPAISTTLFGVLAGRSLRMARDAGAAVATLASAGTLGVIAGELMNPWFPINKQLWSPSFAVFTAGASAIALACCQWLVRSQVARRWAQPFVILGSNAIAVYVSSSVVAHLMESVPVRTGDGIAEGLRLYIFEHFFFPWAGTLNGSLLFAATYLVLWLAPTTALYRRRLFIRI